MTEESEVFVRRIRRNSFLAAVIFCALFFSLGANVLAAGQEIALGIDPQHTDIDFTLGDVLHTVHGTFRAKSGELHFDPSSRKLSGEIVVDARTGQSGNSMRDRKMHREVLESDRYPEIAFRPDYADGPLSLNKKSLLRVHGVFSIHGTEHELTIPAEVELSPENWTATLHFSVPYASWGMKNPSTLFLRVNDSVEIDLAVAGSVTKP
jgi:polyisoprenoid-binding protein YceI